MPAPLLMIPGPTPVQPDVLAALAEPVRSHTGTANAATMLRIQAVLRGIVGAGDARIHVFAGAGTLAMEAALVNHARAGDRVVVISHGYFGDRFTEIATALGMRADTLEVPWGAHASPDEVQRIIQAGDAPAVVCFTHVDTSSGVLAGCDRLARTVRAAAPDAIIVVDGVCATGGIEESMAAWDVDVLLTGAQKALGVPPGLAILALSARAVERRRSIGDVRAYYADLARWDPSVDDPRQYFSTHAVSLLRALEVSLEDVEAEGLPARYERHRRVAGALRHGMGELGFTPLTGADHLAPTLSVLRTPEGVSDVTLREGMEQRGVIVAPCLGPWRGRGIRIGHMGSVGEVEVARTLEAAAAVLEG